MPAAESGAAPGARASAGARRRSRVPSAEAVAQLREVAGVLAQTPQGQGAALRACVQGAAAEELVRHADREVRLWAAKCLAEGLRVFAPEPPLDARRLRAALELFLEQLGALAEPGGASFVHAFGLLERLVEVCAFMLIFDCEDHDALLMKTVKVCLNAARSSEAAKLEGLLNQVLISVLGESDSLPRPVLMLLIEELAPKRQCKFAAGLVRNVLGGLASHSAALSINEFLNGALYGPVPGGDGAEGLETASGKEATAALFCAAYELFDIDPGLVARVLPNLYIDLQCEDADRRRAVTILVGRMLAHSVLAGPSAKPRAPLAATHPLLLDRHLERLADADEDVRLAALEGAAALLVTGASLGGLGGGGCEGGCAGGAAVLGACQAVRQKLLERCLDPSDAVRLCVVRIAAEAAASMAGLRLLAPVLPEIFRRVLDKRPRIREACASAAAELYARHALPAWTEGRGEAAESLAWVPRLLCEAYSVYAGGHLGQTVQLELLIERHLLGCGASLSAQQRASALLGFCASAACQASPAQGLQLLLRRKCEANAALRRYLELRIPRAAPALEDVPAALGQVQAAADRDAGHTAAGAAAAALESLGRLSPTMEDRNTRGENLLVHLRSLDAVRDRALWTHLDRLSSPQARDSTSDMEHLLTEFDRLLRVHRLTDLAPLFRRALLSTWLLPDQVPTLLEAWGHAGQQMGALPFQGNSHHIVVDLVRFFPGAFMPHVGMVVQHLQAGTAERSRAALRMLGALGKRAASVRMGRSGKGADDATDERRALADIRASPLCESTQLVNLLVKAAEALGERQGAAVRGSVCRKAARACALVHGAELHTAMRLALLQVEGEGTSLAFALHFVAACLEQLAAGYDVSEPDLSQLPLEKWQTKSREIMQSDWRQTSEVQLAAMEMCVAAGAEADLLAVMRTAVVQQIRLPLYVVASVLRALRHGTMLLSTALLSQLAAQLCTALAGEESDPHLELVINALQKLQKPSKTRLRLADRLRLCTTLPAMFAFAQAKKHREAMSRALQNSFLKAAQQCTARQEPLLDFALACFLHFLSRLDFFRAEAAAAASAFPESTKLAAFLCESLLRSDPARGTELAGVVLRVCDRARLFVDREDPSSDAVQRAAHALRYVVERRCPELGAHGGGLLRAARGSMPAELFALRPAAGAVAATPCPPVALEAAAPAATPPAGGAPPAATPQKCAGGVESQRSRRTPMAAAGAVRSSGGRLAERTAAKRQRLA